METLTFNPGEVREIVGHLSALMNRIPLQPPANETDYAEAVRVLNGLLDAGGADENHELAPLVDILGSLIGSYEDANHDVPGVTPEAVLRELMNQHNLKQSDLPEIGSQGVISEILSGKRELNTRQIGLLAQRFRISPAVFFPQVSIAA
ncbi:type II toxin-antitoxin system HigA family antitoxin [Paraburkholderia silviterrae]|uniref:Transcriptional regulator n=1 Tax=Paraburkholderia silviterrae TaxID=2528715 RepID=A0A4R5LZ45_9BURK|nr:helix-turn-helix domain-containing protein [Paraburkholderia silviterrae]TDG17859.1 transcriptional regulator [Paraburkholderia silviterrae]